MYFSSSAACWPAQNTHFSSVFTGTASSMTLMSVRSQALPPEYTYTMSSNSRHWSRFHLISAEVMRADFVPTTTSLSPSLR